MWKKDKEERFRKQAISIGLIDSQIKFEKELKHMNNSKNFDNDLYLKGEEWYNSGLSLESADETLKNNLSFIKGYNKGIRMTMIKDNLERKSGRGR